MSELMKCCFCGAERQSDQDGCSEWRLMEVHGVRFYFCPNESPKPGAPAEEFANAKKRAQDRVVELLANRPAPKCQICGCTELNACTTDQGPCEWIVPGVLCSACFDKVPLPSNDAELMATMQPAFHKKVELCLPGFVAFQLLSVIQLACRHPDFVGLTRESMEGLGHHLQAQISSTPALAKMTEAGWMPQYDLAAEGTILLPGKDF